MRRNRSKRWSITRRAAISKDRRTASQLAPGRIYPDDLDCVFVISRLGNDRLEAGNALLSDIVNAKTLMRPERDKYIKLDRPWSHYLIETDW